MRVLHLVESHGLGSEWFITDVIHHQATDHHDLDVVVGCRRRMFSEDVKVPVTLIKCPYYYSQDEWTDPDKCDDEAVSNWYASQIDEFMPDIIHVHFLTEARKVLDLVPHLSPRLVVNIYGGDSCIAFRDFRFRKSLREVWEKSTAVVTICDFLSEQVRIMGCPQEKTQKIPLGLPKALFDQNLRDRNAPVKRIVTAARLTGKKGIDKLIVAFSLVFNDSQVTLDIFGDGEAEADLRQLIADLGLEGRVTLHGFVHRQHLVDRLPDFDLYVLPSHTAADFDEEGTPTVLLEVQALGLPAIATFHAGIPEIYTESNHLLLSRQNDITSLCLTMERYLNHADRNALVHQARAFVQSHHSIEVAVNAHYQHYQTLIIT